MTNPKPDTLVEQWIASVKSHANGRTRYEGQPPFRDEAVVAEIERLRTEGAKLVDENNQLQEQVDSTWDAVSAEREACAIFPADLMREIAKAMFAQHYGEPTATLSPWESAGDHETVYWMSKANLALTMIAQEIRSLDD